MALGFCATVIGLVGQHRHVYHGYSDEGKWRILRSRYTLENQANRRVLE